MRSAAECRWGRGGCGANRIYTVTAPAACSLWLNGVMQYTYLIGSMQHIGLMACQAETKHFLQQIKTGLFIEIELFPLAHLREKGHRTFIHCLLDPLLHQISNCEAVIWLLEEVCRNLSGSPESFLDYVLATSPLAPAIPSHPPSIPPPTFWLK